jgi:predicted MFS family arabinose efflux permease
VGGWLSLPLLLVAAALLGVGSSLTGAARLLLVRSVVPGEQLTRALTLDEVRQNGAALVGPAIGGALYGIRALAHAAPFLFTACSFVVALASAAVTWLLPGGAGEPGPGAEAAGEEAAGEEVVGVGMLAGVRTLWRQRALRSALVLLMMVNTVGVGLDLVIIVILRNQAVPSGTIGLALGCGAIGGLAGAPLVKLLHRLPPGMLLIALVAAWVPLSALIAVPFGPWWVGGLTFLIMLGLPAVRVMIDILVLRRAAPSERGRVVGALMTLIAVGIPAGLAGTGLLLQLLPAQSAMLTLAALLAVAALYGASSRDLRQARWPQ